MAGERDEQRVSEGRAGDRAPLHEPTLIVLPSIASHPSGSRHLFQPSIPVEGERVGGSDGSRFEIKERLGAGGMAVVMLAKDSVLDRMVAIKFILSEVLGASGDAAVERFKLEAIASARLSHENIVRVFDLGGANGVPFLVMEHLQGRPLSGIVADGSVSALDATRILRDVARGLAYAHKAGVVHRDLKPSNVFVGADGRAKILDFGLARIAFGSGPTDMHPDTVVGTPRYMSPEQWRGEEQDGRTDIWAVGVTFFELLAGRPPFEGPSLVDLQRCVLSRDPAPLLRSIRPDLPEAAERIARGALAKELAKRTPSADELVQAFDELEAALAGAAAPKIDGARNPGPRAGPERRQMTFASCALSNVTFRSEQLDREEPSEDFSDLHGRFLEVCASVVRQLEGTIVSSLGGRVIACFGCPIEHDDDALRAVRAGFMIVDAAEALGGDRGPRRAQIGIHTSFATADWVSGGRGAETHVVHGNAPHVATWLERRAPPGNVLISRSTRTQLARSVDVEPFGAMPRGEKGPMELFRVVRPRAR